MTIIPTKPIPEGNVTAKATDRAEHPNNSTSDPVEVTTDPNTKVELLDKDGNVIGSGITDGTGHAFITPTKPIPEGNVYVKATDNAARPNSSVSKPVKTTDTTPPPKPVVKGSMNGKAGTKRSN